jgi:hypothetical protein
MPGEEMGRENWRIVDCELIKARQTLTRDSQGLTRVHGSAICGPKLFGEVSQSQTPVASWENDTRGFLNCRFLAREFRQRSALTSRGRLNKLR